MPPIKFSLPKYYAIFCLLKQVHSCLCPLNKNPYFIQIKQQQSDNDNKTAILWFYRNVVYNRENPLKRFQYQVSVKKKKCSSWGFQWQTFNGRQIYSVWPLQFSLHPCYMEIPSEIYYAVNCHFHNDLTVSCSFRKTRR